MKREIELYKLLFLFLIQILSLGLFFKYSGSAYEWPAIDMVPYIERHLDSNFLLNDYFTNTSSLPGPREIFGNLIILMIKCLHSSWYDIYFILRIVLTITIPSLFFTLICGYAKEYEKPICFHKTFIIFLLCSLVLIHKTQTFFSIAWWQPIFMLVHPQSVSLLLGLIGINIFLFTNGKKWSYFFLFLASLIHPTIGLSLIILHLIYLFTQRQKQISKFNVIGYIGSFVIAAIILLILYPSAHPLGAQEFVDIYVKNHHSSHYLPSEFGTLTKYPWWIHFTLINLLLGINIIISLLKKNIQALHFSMVGFTCYFTFVAVQYLFVEVIPVKVIAVIGLSRLTYLGYWFWAISLAMLFGSYQFEKHRTFFKLPLKQGITITIIISLLLMIYGVQFKDNPHERIVKQNNKIFYSWIINNTNKDDVFAVFFGDLRVDLPLIYRRAVFCGNGFPFNEDSIIEYNKRASLLNGTFEDIKKIKGNWIGEKISQYFQKLSPEDFVKISKTFKLDYVIVDQINQFKEFVPSYIDNQKAVFKISNLQKK